MKIVITGASGFLGGRLFHLFGKEHDVAGTYYDTERRDYHQLDITNHHQVVDLVQNLDPDVIVHTAAIADPDTCHKNEHEAFEINHKGTENIANAARRVGAKLVHISTSFVFPGGGHYSPADNPSPINIYGTTKYKAEIAVREAVDDHIILRCPKIFGVSETNCVEDLTVSILEKLTTNEVVELDDTTERYPVFVDDIAAAIQRLLDIDARGIYHISTDTPYTKYEFGLKVSQIFDVSGDIVPVEGNPLVERPSGIRLDSTTLSRLGIDITPVDSALDIIQHQQACSFKKIYSFKPDRMVEGESASKIRADLGKALASEDDLDADIVVPIPESGIYPAMGYADQTGIPLYHGIIRDYETKKTLYEPNVDDRTRKLRKKLVAISDILDGQRIVLVDEAIISGLTLATVIDKCHASGVSEIHVRIPSPPMRTQCNFGVLSGDADIIADGDSTDREQIQTNLREKFDLESLRFLSTETFTDIVPSEYGFTCTDCFDRGPCE